MGSNDSLPFVGHKTLGIDPALTHTTQKHELGLIQRGSDGREYVYVVAGSAITAAFPVTLSTGYSVANSASGDFIFGVAPVAIASGSYGWVQIRGQADSANVATGTAAGAVLDAYADANGDFVTNAGVTDPYRGIALAAESGGLANIFLV
jgi:hypothetical protein